MSGVVTINTGRWLRAMPWRASLAFVMGTLIVVALSVPAVLAPGTRTGATIAAALLAGALIARGRAVMPRVVVGGAMGLALALTISATALLLVRDEPDAAVWQVIIREVVTHSMIAPLDEVFTPWLGGFEQIEEHLLIARFAVSNLVLNLSGGLLGGLLASGSAPGRSETPCAKEETEGQPPDGVEDGSDGAQHPQDKDAEKQQSNGAEDGEEPENGDGSPSEAEKERDQCT